VDLPLTSVWPSGKNQFLLVFLKRLMLFLLLDHPGAQEWLFLNLPRSACAACSCTALEKRRTERARQTSKVVSRVTHTEKRPNAPVVPKPDDKTERYFRVVGIAR
jgi:hypothetical protein